ncbi:cellulose synthase/poly-beta-1,6-N-acetylglucosamine synthase-like glycosyltransferase [Rhodococcus ruber]|uniref:glycosyltransferase n=1 Tax=Rhodococcus ruber TaxID=1830 RepID=UPI001AEB3799|nr:glycosyltransferase [Rhodococcus ruber]MBP2213117.1 cellulose synthase/poly-beta-1,6-N-acetylglucosamine synthase-like glycosyltransferase [Rhodococcus ruber]
MARHLVDEEFKAAALHDAVYGLREKRPLSSASVAFVPWQKWLTLGLVAVVILALVFVTIPTLTMLTAVCTAGYIATLADRLLLFSRGLARDAIFTVDDDEARAVPEQDLPTYTVLVPAYNEPEVVGDLIAAMTAIDYPAEKLQVLLLLEEDDAVTIAAAREAGLGEIVEILLVPAADPRTKPKACNYGLHFATGDVVTIFDAEDLPEPLQLRRVAVAFDRLGDDVACVQAKLAFHNGTQNMLTGWFTADYALWFNFVLPGLMRSNSPIPLGGTSNHIRRSVFDEIGAWDPYNVTEDADLGVRIAESGYRTAVLDSTTLEEANSDPINWIRQRSRWYKGYLQTWLVHVRRPVQLWRGIGTVGMLRFTTLLAGTPIIACLNMVFWLITISWLLGQPFLVEEIFPWYVYFPALISLVFGNSAVLYMNLVACRETGNSALWLACLTVPLYWLMMSVAAIKGTYQLIRNPSYWEKTFHGLSS